MRKSRSQRLFKYARKRVKYAIAGAISFLVNLLSYLAIDRYLRIPYILVSALAFSLTQIASFMLDKYWTFQGLRWSLSKRMKWEFTEYFIVSTVALGMNLFMFYLFVEYFNFHQIIAQIISILIASTIGFVGHKYWIFR